MQNKKGNIIIIVVCIVLALMITLVYLLKNTTSRIYTTKKIGMTLYARELANTLARLSIQYLNQQLLNKTDDITEILSKPLKGQGGFPNNSGEKNLLPHLKAITKSDDNNCKILDMLISKSGLIDLKIEKLYWYVLLDDFAYINIKNQNIYPREKYGLIHINMDFSYVLPGKKNTNKERNKESYHFVSDVKVVANIIPVLSRFTLYIDDALDGDKDDLERFNVVDGGTDGRLRSKTSNNFVPWILNNHGAGYGVDKNINSYDKIIESSRGLVFLGGAEFDEKKAIRLGLAFSDNDGENEALSPYGEGFHFYYNAESGNYYWQNQTVNENFDLWNDGEPAGILTCNMGLCNALEKDHNSSDDSEDEEFEDEDDKYLDYFEYTGGSSPADKYSSIFRLYGTDDHPSPTLVLGHVDAKYVSVKMYRYDDTMLGYDILPNYNSSDDFKIASCYDKDKSPFDDDDDEGEEEVNDNDEDEEEDNDKVTPDEDLTHFAFEYRKAHSHKKLEFDSYLKNFSSRIELDSYNKGYPYVLNQKEEFPFKNHVIEGEKFKRLLRKKDADIYVEVPKIKGALYQDIYGDTIKLGMIKEFLNLDNLNLNNPESNNTANSDNKTKNDDRIAHYLTLTNEDNADKNGINSFCPKDIEKDFIKYLKSKGILVNDKINLNGWLFINNETNNDFVINFKNMKIVSNGGIILSKGNLHIKSDINAENNNLLTILTLGPNEDIIIEDDASTINASLISGDGQVKLDGKGPDLIVNGNIVMNKIHRGEEGINAMMRGVKLNYNVNLSAKPFIASEEEKNLLMFNLSDNPKIIK